MERVITSVTQKAQHIGYSICEFKLITSYTLSGLPYIYSDGFDLLLNFVFYVFNHPSNIFILCSIIDVHPLGCQAQGRPDILSDEFSTYLELFVQNRDCSIITDLSILLC